MPGKKGMHQAVVEQIKQTKVSVCTVEDQKRWLIPLYMINIRGSDVAIEKTQREGLTRNEISIGDTVGFLDRDGGEKSGKVVRLNQKTVGIDCEDGGSWRVSYPLLHKVIEISC